MILKAPFSFSVRVCLSTSMNMDALHAWLLNDPAMLLTYPQRTAKMTYCGELFEV